MTTLILDQRIHWDLASLLTQLGLDLSTAAMLASRRAPTRPHASDTVRGG